MTDVARQIILIMIDTQRKDMVGCYGNPNMLTPNEKSNPEKVNCNFKKKS